MNNKIFEVSLLNDMTGRIKVKNISRKNTGKNLRGFWSVEVDGIETVSGQFIIHNMIENESKEYLLSPEIGAVYPNQRQYLIIKICDDDNSSLHCSALKIDIWCRKNFPEEKSEFFTGMRFDPVQSIISSGKLASLITASGMKELTFNGEKLIDSAPVLRIWRAGAESDDKITALQLDRMKISSDRFGIAGENSVEIHSLALPKAMDADELEFTQRFTPVSSGAIRYDLEFIVPESFSGVPRLGIEFKLPDIFTESICGGSLLKENFWTRRKIISGEKYSDVDFALFTAENPEYPGLLIASGGKSFYLSVTDFSEFAMLDALEYNSSLKPDGLWCHIDCISDENGQLITAGRYRMVLIFAAFTGDIPVEAAARKKTLFC